MPIFFVVTRMKFNLTTLIEAGRLRPENPAAVVSAGLLSVLIFPLLALVLRGHPDPVPAAKTSHVG